MAARQTTPVVAVAAALMVLRALVYLLFEQVVRFRQRAIRGLYGQLSVGRAFPLFAARPDLHARCGGPGCRPATPVAESDGPAALRYSLLTWNIRSA